MKWFGGLENKWSGKRQPGSIAVEKLQSRGLRREENKRRLRSGHETMAMRHCFNVPDESFLERKRKRGV